MAISDLDLLYDRPHPAGIGGRHRVYRFPCGAGVSLANSPIAHAYPYAWEAAILKDVDASGGEVDHDTPFGDPEDLVFQDVAETNGFINRARSYFAKQDRPDRPLKDPAPPAPAPKPEYSITLGSESTLCCLIEIDGADGLTRRTVVELPKVLAVPVGVSRAEAISCLETLGKIMFENGPRAACDPGKEFDELKDLSLIQLR